MILAEPTCHLVWTQIELVRGVGEDDDVFVIFVFLLSFGAKKGEFNSLSSRSGSEEEKGFRVYVGCFTGSRSCPKSECKESVSPNSPKTEEFEE